MSSSSSSCCGSSIKLISTVDDFLCGLLIMKKIFVCLLLLRRDVYVCMGIHITYGYIIYIPSFLS
jgi:hypothetical protein